MSALHVQTRASVYFFRKMSSSYKFIVIKFVANNIELHVTYIYVAPHCNYVYWKYIVI